MNQNICIGKYESIESGQTHSYVWANEHTRREQLLLRGIKQQGVKGKKNFCKRISPDCSLCKCSARVMGTEWLRSKDTDWKRQGKVLMQIVSFYVANFTTYSCPYLFIIFQKNIIEIIGHAEEYYYPDFLQIRTVNKLVMQCWKFTQRAFPCYTSQIHKNNIFTKACPP